MSHEYKLASMSLLLVGLVSGCGDSNIRVCTEPTYSKLAGRWSTTFEAMDRAVTGGQNYQKPYKNLEAEEVAKSRTVLVTIMPNGMVDWSRSHIGSVLRLQGLEEVGDECIDRRNLDSRLKLVSAEYTPTRTAATVDRFSLGGKGDFLIEKYVMSLELNEDSTAVLNWRCENGSRPESWAPLKLTRHENRRLIVDNRSLLVGKWSLTHDSNEAVLVIREDGTIDWAGSEEGLLGQMYQLQFPGDRAWGWYGRLKLERATYTADCTSLRIRIRHPQRDNSARLEIHVTRVDDEHIKVRASRTGWRGEELQVEKTIIRNESASDRAFSILGSLADADASS